MTTQHEAQNSHVRTEVFKTHKKIIKPILNIQINWKALLMVEFLKLEAAELLSKLKKFCFESAENDSWKFNFQDWR